MIQLKEEKIEKIVTCGGTQTVESIISSTIIEMQDEGVMNDIIMEFIQEFELSLMLHENNRESAEELNNIKHAREILMNKILNGIEA